MNAPTLLIGLGGTGCKIVEKVSNMVTEEQRQNIAFAVFDTDINDLRGIQERSPYIRTIQTSTKQTVGEYLNKDTHARDSWFPVNAILNGKTLTEGAGQVRSISRLALETVIRAGRMEPLHEAIQSLYRVEEDKADQALRVVLVGSLAGGTGSGLILPVAMYVRNYLATRFRQSANITRGFFILPEVFYEVIPGQAERNNLKANAYAALRELDAFLMKGDATLPERYMDSVRMQFPRAASEGYEEYDIRPYDFCFLFDAQNAEGGKLSSFEQYLDHAANCIYAQSIGPMNKRSNSSEDNTIRKLAKERGRNRYAGAGASMLVYPFEDIRTFIALKWARQSVSKQWLVFDNRFNEMCKENEQKREEGLAVVTPQLSTFYVNQIESDEKHDEPFARAIVKATGIYENGVTRTGDRWKVYVAALMEKIKRDVQECSSELSSKRDDVRERINNLAKEWEEYAEAYRKANEYRMLSEIYVEEMAQTIGYSLFKGSKSGGDAEANYKLETYLVSEDKQFLHPNAIRYMLIKIRELLKKQKEVTDRKVEANRTFFNNFEKNTFKSEESGDGEATADDLMDRKLTVFEKLSSQPTGDQEDIKTKLRNYLKKIEEYSAQCAQATVLGQGLVYIDSLITAFEEFYQAFDSKVEGLDKSIDAIYKKYSDSKGSTIRYVCASRECLDYIYEKKPYTGSNITIDSDLARDIYTKIHAYAMMKDKPKNNQYYSDLFDKGIIGYFKDAVMISRGNELDVDIITAIEKEAECRQLFDTVDDASGLIDQYVRKVIADTRKLSCPFIESPLGEAQDPINSCTFNIGMRPDRGDESPRAQLIRKELMNYGGAPDEDIPKYMIMFYQSFYGLRANDLSKFAPPEKSMTYKREGGEYFKAYYELVKGIHPETHRSKEISPHIDRWWHNVTKMPDLDDDNQRKQEYEIYAAFFWAVIRGYVYLTEAGADLMVYRLKNILLDMEDDRLIVSNGTECDKFYEVLDAMAIYPELVSRILSAIRKETEEDLNENGTYEDGILYSALQRYSLTEPGIGSENKPSLSIFDIPMLMKKSVTQENYYENNVIEMFEVMIEEIHNYLSKFCSKKELPKVMGALIEEQFEKHLESLAEESKSRSSVYKDSLFGKTGDILVKALSELGLRQEAKKMEEQISALK